MPNDESIALPFYRRWWFALAAGALVQFLVWCIADVFYVRYGLRESESLVISSSTDSYYLQGHTLAALHHDSRRRPATRRNSS